MPQDWTQRDWVSLDTETTGIDTETARIVSMALLRVRPDGSVDAERSLVTLVNPGVEVPEEAARVHGIRAEQLAGAPDTEAALARLSVMMGFALEEDLPMVVYNSTYDVPLVHAEARRCSRALWVPRLRVLDPLVLDRHVDRYRRGRRNLTSVSEHYGCPVGEGAHGAEPDALAAARVMREMLCRHPRLAELDLETLEREQARSHRAMYERMGWQMPHAWPGYPS